ncbi:MAG: sigma-70 family RNA polymerase sigma factor [Bacteroidota bacterium]|nr:sigma-70 family RNA polymerase sigma factor [Bacteroidota bacterium]MDX5447404.1 sigma-70 family RNA polymerase sigma factor [Bacteroidota bacterium]MDX5505321.1 sigma-70 family RNA polymerase sigma factor [Bacteroidota bacterium]
MEEPKEIRMNCDVPALWLEHKNLLRNFILKRVKDPDLTDDILQDVLMKVYAFCMSRSGVRNVRSWLLQIAQNTISDHYRRNSKFTQMGETEELETENDEEAFEDATQFILPMLEFLPKKYSIPLKLADIDNVKQSEIADRLQLSLTATKSRIQRARQLLKEEFITCCHFETDAQGNIISFEVKESCEPLQKLKQQHSKTDPS